MYTEFLRGAPEFRKQEKKPMKRLIREFKTFIKKGSVMDLAVGVIIGSAFTAIVTALVQSILTPLINWIPGTGNTSALQTVLREAVTDSQGNVLTEALILDWGRVMGALITFMLTALVLFFIMKGFNKLKEAGEMVKTAAEKLQKKEEDDGTQAEAEPAAVVPAEVLPPKETTEELLKQIVELIKGPKA